MRFPRRLEGSIDVAGGHREGGRGEGRRVKDKRKEGGRVEEAWYAGAVVWMRELRFDPKSETEIESTRGGAGIAGRQSWGQRGSDCG